MRREALNRQTARIRWAELQRHFARGVVLRAAGHLDLVAVAAAMADDDRERVAAWQATGELAPATDDEARAWHADDAELWAVVVAPFVLVQEPRQP